MPNSEPQENDFPPGLNFPRTSSDRFQLATGSFGSIPDHSISPSLSGLSSTITSPPLTASATRSFGMFDRDQLPANNTWAPDAIGKRTLSLQGSQEQGHIVPMLPSHHPSPQSIPGATSAPFNFDGGAHPFVPSSIPERDTFSRGVQSANGAVGHFPITASALNASAAGRTLCWGDLEPWMDEEYAKQVISFMKWDALIQIPPAGPGTAANNPGYGYLTFPSASHATAVLAQINSKPVSMPNSSKQFTLSWATMAPTPSSMSSSPPAQSYAKEYSIFVGDLAPEASNTDLVAVFRNPVLGLRNDREPKFIRPFMSCKSAKIMLDPVTGISRGYGFVRFTEEADQQRALIEMHGLYCLSRPMRISPATAKFRPPPPSFDLPQVQMPSQNTFDTMHPPLTSAYTAPEKTFNSVPSISPHGSLSSASAAALSANSAPKADELASFPPNIMAQLTQTAAANRPSGAPAHLAPLGSVTATFSGRQALATEPGRHAPSEDSGKYQAQVRAILSSLIGPNGEQLTSTDPYNTTVFVGGLSPLISEETLRTFFAPFGDIHYVKVPAGKHCGFVQFVRKTDAERAIEKMQGFPIGGSRIRLSWGRSQYKAAQAAAQAAQNAALQLAQTQTHPSGQPQPPSQVQHSPPQPQPQPQPQIPTAPQPQLQPEPTNNPITLSPEQAVQILRSLGFTNFVAAQNGQVQPTPDGSSRRLSEESLRSLVMARASEESNRPFDIYSTSGSSTARSESSNGEESRQRPQVSFSPFLPESDSFPGHTRRSSAVQGLPQVKNNLVAAFGENGAASKEFAGGMVSPGSGIPQHTSRPSSGSFSQFSAHPPANAAISRPPSSKYSPPRSESRSSREQDSLEDVNGTLASLNLGSGWAASEQDTSDAPA